MFFFEDYTAPKEAVIYYIYIYSIYVFLLDLDVW